MRANNRWLGSGDRRGSFHENVKNKLVQRVAITTREAGWAAHFYRENLVDSATQLNLVHFPAFRQAHRFINELIDDTGNIELKRQFYSQC